MELPFLCLFSPKSQVNSGRYESKWGNILKYVGSMPYWREKSIGGRKTSPNIEKKREKAYPLREKRASGVEKQAKLSKGKEKKYTLKERKVHRG